MVFDFPLPYQAALLLCCGIFIGGLWQIVSWFLLNRDPKDFRLGPVKKGTRARVVEWRSGYGFIDIGGERWQAHCAKDLKPGDRVKVSSVEGLKLTVRRDSRAR